MQKAPFWPLLSSKKVVQYGEWLLSDVLKHNPHRQWVFRIPKRSRIYFLFDRKLLAKLSKCTFNVIRAYLAHADPGGNAVPGASIAAQTYGDFLNFNPHLHAIVSDGCFLNDNSFHVAPGLMGTWKRPSNRPATLLVRPQIMPVLDPY
jgi:hypothetical protein